MLNLNLGCKGEYRLIRSKKPNCQEIVQDTGFFSNLVLNNGIKILQTRGIRMSEYGHENVLSFLCVGSGTAAPTPGQTSLGSLVASISTLNRGSMSRNYERGYFEYAVNREFAQGAASGNISEVGLGAQSVTDLFSRALITDAEGNPTTITVLSDEYLTVQYRLRIYMPKVDITQSIIADINGTPTPIDITIRVHRANQAVDSQMYPTPYTASNQIGLTSSAALYPPTGQTLPTTNASSIVNEAYNESTFTRYTKIRFGITAAVSQTANRLLMFNFGPFSWQALFSIPIPKTDEQILDFRIGMQYTRPA